MKSAYAKLKTYDSDISELSTEIERKQDLAVRATIEGNHSLAKQFKEHINNLHEKIIDTKIKKERIKISIEKVENTVSHDLFS